MDPGAILSHVTVIEVSSYPKLIVCGDVAVLPAPELKEKIALTNYYIATAHALGIEKPKVAIIAATEQMSYKMPACVDAAIISKMADRGGIKGALVDGPLALDVAVDPEAVEIKGLKSPVAGDADVLVFPTHRGGQRLLQDLHQAGRRRTGRPRRGRAGAVRADLARRHGEVQAVLDRAGRADGEVDRAAAAHNGAPGGSPGAPFASLPPATSARRRRSWLPRAPRGRAGRPCTSATISFSPG